MAGSTEHIQSLLEGALKIFETTKEARNCAIQQRDDAKALIITKASELVETQAKLERAVADLQDARTIALLDNEKMRDLIERNMSLEAKLAHSQTSLATVKGELDRDRQELSTVTAALAHERLALQEANASVLDLNRRCADFKSDLGSRDTTISHLVSRQKRIEAELFDWKQDCARLKLQASADAAVLQDVKREHEIRLMGLSGALALAVDEREKEKNSFVEENGMLVLRVVSAEDRLQEVHARYAEVMRMYSAEKAKVASQEEVIRKIATPLRRSNRISEASSETENLVTPPRRRVSAIPPLTAGVNRAHRSLTKKMRRLS